MARLLITRAGVTRAVRGAPDALAEIAAIALLDGVPAGIANRSGYVEAHGRRLLSRLAENGSGRISLGGIGVQLESGPDEKA